MKALMLKIVIGKEKESQVRLLMLKVVVVRNIDHQERLLMINVAIYKEFFLLHFMLFCYFSTNFPF